MGHVTGATTTKQHRFYHSSTRLASAPANFAALSAIITAANEIDEVMEVGDMGEDGNIISYVVFGGQSQRRVALQGVPSNMSLQLACDYSKAKHVEIAGLKSGDDIALCSVLSAKGLTGGDLIAAGKDHTVVYLSGTVGGVKRMQPSGHVTQLMVEVALFEIPVTLASS